MSNSENKDLLVFSEAESDIRFSVSKGDFGRAIKNFRDNAPSFPVARLYDAYRWLKEQIDQSGPDSASEAAYFNDVFLRILEERGESAGGIYRTVLRDSSEFKLLHGVLGKSCDREIHPQQQLPLMNEITEEAHEKITLKKILSSETESLGNYSKDEWDILVDEHFISIDEETSLVKSSKQLLGRISKRKDCEDYHLESIIGYVFNRLLSFDELQVSTKEFALKTLSLVCVSKDSWSRLHSLYTGIIMK